MDLAKLSEPFDLADIEWRVSRAGMGSKGIYCNVLAYVTARAIQRRLDEVCGQANWRNEEPKMVEFQVGKYAFVCGISIRIDDEWVTKWDVAEPTREQRGFEGTSAKGGFSSSVKRAGSQWGIAQYLYDVKETRADVSNTGGKGWNWARLPKDQGGAEYYWKPPTLPGWALPKLPEHEISLQELNELKAAWKAKFAPESKNPKELLEGFTRFVQSICGEYPVNDRSCWIRDNWDKCMMRINETTEPSGPDSDIPFGDQE